MVSYYSHPGSFWINWGHHGHFFQKNCGVSSGRNALVCVYHMHAINRRMPDIRQSIERGWRALPVLFIMLRCGGRLLVEQCLVLKCVLVHSLERPHSGCRSVFVMPCLRVGAAGVGNVQKAARVAVRHLVRPHDTAQSNSARQLQYAYDHYFYHHRCYSYQYHWTAGNQHHTSARSIHRCVRYGNTMMTDKNEWWSSTPPTSEL